MNFRRYCLKCPKAVHCCINGFVYITKKNAEQIKKTTKLPYIEFIDNSPLPKKIISSMKDEDPCLEGAMNYRQLDRGRLSRLKKTDKHCIFFENGRCSIYRVRPNICRIYPFWAMRLVNGRLKVIEHDVESQCSIVKGKEIDKILTAKDKKEIKKIFREIEVNAYP